MALNLSDSAWLSFYLAQGKLQATSRISALLSGFVMVSMVEVHLSHDIPPGLLITFTVSTTLVVCVNLIALFVSTCILPHIDAISAYRDNDSVPADRDASQNSPHVRLHRYIEISWVLSTGIGILLFLAQMTVVGWVRLDHLSRPAAIVTTVIIIPSIILFTAFSIQFYRHLIAYKYRTVTGQVKQLESEVDKLEEYLTNASSV